MKKKKRLVTDVVKKQTEKETKETMTDGGIRSRDVENRRALHVAKPGKDLTTSLWKKGKDLIALLKNEKRKVKK